MRSVGGAVTIGQLYHRAIGTIRLNRGVAQMEARSHGVRKAVGSSPTTPTFVLTSPVSLLHCVRMITTDQTIAMASYFATRPQVVAVYLYGSHARGSANQLSDVDIAVMMDHVDKRTSQLQLDAIGALMGIFQRNDVDVQMLTTQTAPVLALRMIRGTLLYCRSLTKKTELEAQILSRSQDFEPFIQLQLQEMEKRLKEGTYASG